MGPIAVLAAYVCIILVTKPVDFADTIYYVQDILKFNSAPDAHARAQLLDFGHLLWRPLGWVLLQASIFLGRAASWSDGRFAATQSLVWVSMLSGAITAVLTLSLLRRLALPATAALIASIVLISSNAGINSAQAGNSYALALALLTAAVWVISGDAVQRRHSSAYAWLAGCFTALSFCTWFPFVLAVPAVAFFIAIPWFGERRLRSVRFCLACHTIAAIVLTSALVFGTGAYLLHLRNTADVLNWVSASSHGLRESSRLLRAGMGIPRCCIPMGDDGIVWKRFLFHDHYAHATVTDVLIKGSLLKLAAFYTMLGLLTGALARISFGRVILLLLFTAAFPVLIFAIFFYEPSSTERFMSVFPFLAIAVAYALTEVWNRASRRRVALALVFVVVTLNLTFHLNGQVDQIWQPTVARLELLQQAAPPGSTIILVDTEDQLHSFLKDNPLYRRYPDGLNFLAAIRVSSERVFRWRQILSQRISEAWAAGPDEEVWVSERLRARTPAPEWLWVEGDDSAIRWRDLPDLFAQFEYDKKIGGNDGFVRLARSARNRELLQHLAEPGGGTSEHSSTAQPHARSATF